MASILVMLGLPLLAALLTLVVRGKAGRAVIVWGGGLAVMAVSVYVAVTYYNGGFTANLAEYEWLKPCVLALEALLAAYVIYRSVRGKSWLTALFAAAGVTVTVWYEFAYHVEGAKALYIDRLTVLMILIIGIVGMLITIYAVGYMDDYHRHHKDVKDNRGKFIALLFVFTSAMFGLVIANDMSLMLLCWEVTSLCSFLLIGYTKTPEATRNAFLALVMNVGGGLCFAVGIVIFGVYFHTNELTGLLALKGETGVWLSVAALLLATAGMTKSAQMPFSKWLLGAMVAPTPSSALLHSSTMVKAGVYLIIRLSPLLGHNAVGVTVTAIGGLTFLITAILAVAQSDAKKILAYSTISNLGLIVACAGIGSAEALWAAVMLIVFHAIAKSLLFLSTGTAEHHIGSRDVESMDGLYRVSTAVTLCFVVGIAGMFIAPFGMLISKWAAMKAFIDSGSVLTVMIVAFGGSITLFFWTKWLGKLLANAHHHPHKAHFTLRGTEKTALYTLAALVVAVCLAHPIVSKLFIEPFITGTGMAFVLPVSTMDSSIIIAMLCAMFVLPVALFPFYHRRAPKAAMVYMAGENAGDDKAYIGAMGNERKVELKNWYLTSFLRIERWEKPAFILCAGVLLAGLFAAIGGFVL